ncbi:MAG: hypothetical protein NZ988_02400 [Thaumarchaeota archaeon]|nr:hypothetical protein [Candidatus Calditenuaceae archaeon]MDW8186886.1 hypothetical protein [Nitrososphaerota archaeon]
MRREDRLTVRRTGKGLTVKVGMDDWLGLLALVLAIAFVLLLWAGRALEAALVGSFGGGLSLSEMVRRTSRRPCAR